MFKLKCKFRWGGSYGMGIVWFVLAGVPSLRADVTYQEVIRPLFQNSCLNCHNPDKDKAGLDLSTYDATMDGSDNGKVVETGDPDKSLLLKVITHTEEPYMPKGGDKLPDSQIEIIRQWIEANAPEKVGGMVAKTNSGPSIAVVPVENKPKGPPAMPRDGLLQPVIHTRRLGTVPSVDGSPWAPLVALAAQKQVLLYNTDTQELAGVLPFPEGFPAIVRFSRNGGLLIAGGGIGAKLGHVVIWDVVTGKRVAEIGDEFDTVLAADISPDQSLVALGGPNRLVKIFAASDGHMICKMKKHTEWVTALSFTPDGKSLISGDRAGGLAVWDTQGHELQTVSAHAAEITGIACRGSLVATSSEDGTVKFWDIVEGKQIKSWKAHPQGVRSVAFTADGLIVTSGRDKLVRTWDVNGKLIRQFDPLADIAMQATAAGGKIIAADWTGVVREWTPDGKRVGDLDSNPPMIGERIDALNRRMADLQEIVAQGPDAVNRATGVLAAARKSAAGANAALSAKRVALAAARSQLAIAGKRAAVVRAGIQQVQQEAAGYGIISGELATAAGVNPLLEPAADSELAVREAALQTAAAEKAGLGPMNVAVDAAGKRCGELMADVSAAKLAASVSAGGVTGAESALAGLQGTAQGAAEEMKKDGTELIRWRGAEARLAGAPEYAARKADGK